MKKLAVPIVIVMISIEVGSWVAVGLLTEGTGSRFAASLGEEEERKVLDAYRSLVRQANKANCKFKQPGLVLAG